MVDNKLSFMDYGAAAYTGIADHYVRFTMSHQLLDADTWKNFVHVFTEDSDDETQGWRCEFWGKMMRGACLIYMYNKSDALYAVLISDLKSPLLFLRLLTSSIYYKTKKKMICSLSLSYL